MTWVGQRVARKEDMPLVTGTGTYVPDFNLPGTLEVAFVRSPLAHARINSINTTQALAAEGVVAIYTGPDIRDHVHALVLDQEAAPPGLETAEPEIRPATIEILAELVRVDYEELPAALDPELARLPGAAIVFDNVPNNVQARYRIRVGDAGAALDGAEHTLAMTIRYKLGLTGTKIGCDRAECGACTVLIDDVPHYSCSVLAQRTRGKKITTIEGLADAATGFAAAVEDFLLERVAT